MEVIMSKQHFQHVGGLRPGRSAFDLSHDHKTTIQMGKLYPVTCIECVPGDKFTMFNEIVARFQPMIAPILHQVDIYTHTFFVPYRLLWGSVNSMEFYPSEPVRAWENFITGGPQNNFAIPLPRWTYPTGTNVKKTLWDYFGFPMSKENLIGAVHARDDFWPLDFPRRAYNFIWNEYYRDQQLQDKTDWNNDKLLNRCWEKDYFTIARPSRQLGQALAIPLSGRAQLQVSGAIGSSAGYANVYGSFPSTTTTPTGGTLKTLTTLSVAAGGNQQLVANMADGVGTFDVSDLRQIFQLQKWQERNARAGTRYREFVPAHYGVSIRDDRLDRPEYIGGTKSPIIISEVLQTGETSNVSPQANMAGHGITADTTKIGSYFVREHGLIMTILSVRPRTSYVNTTHRSWLRRTRYDFYFPEFAHLSEQAIYKGELGIGVQSLQTSSSWDPFGFQGIYDELRYLPSIVTGDMRSILRYWHLSRYITPVLDGAGEQNVNVSLNADFVKCNPRIDVFAVQKAPDPDNNNQLTPVDQIILNYASRIKAIRPLPFLAEPGLVDHF